MKNNQKYLITGAVLFFILYSFSLANLFFEYGRAGYYFGGFELMWILTIFYLVMLIAGARAVLVPVRSGTYLTLGILPFAFITALLVIYGIMAVAEPQQYDGVPVFGIVLLVLSVCSLIAYGRGYLALRKKSKETQPPISKKD